MGYSPRSVSASDETNPFAVISSPPAKAGDETERTPPPLEVLLSHGLIGPKPKPSPEASDQEKRSRAQQASALRLTIESRCT